MTSKAEYIEAHRRLMELHESETWNLHHEPCPLCVLTDDECSHCTQHVPVDVLQQYVLLKIDASESSCKLCDDMLTLQPYVNNMARARYHREAIQILTDLPEQRFLKHFMEGFGFSELFELDERIALEEGLIK